MRAKAAKAEKRVHEGGQHLLWARVDKSRMGVLTTVSDKGLVRSRPMTVQKVEPDGTIWFFMRADGDVAATFASAARVNASFANPDDKFFLSVAGHASLIDDRQKVEALWTPAARAWFPEGPAAPELRLLRLDPVRVDAWTSCGAKLLQFLANAKAAARTRRTVKEAAVGD